MFDLKNFIVTNTVNGVKNGTFTKEYVNIMAVNYMLKGVLLEEDVISISTQIESWEAEQNAVVEPVEPSEDENPVEDVVGESEEETVEEPVEEEVAADDTTEETQTDDGASTDEEGEEPEEGTLEENVEETA